MKTHKLILGLLSSILFSQSFAQSAKESISLFIQSNVDSIYKKENVPGIFVGVLNNNEKHYYTAGLANKNTKLSFDEATIFEIGSITKTFTAYVLTAVLIENKIAESDFILKYLPDSIQQNEKLKDISFVNLMNHTSGLPRLPSNIKVKSFLQPYEKFSEHDLYAYLKNSSPNPVGKNDYSNLGAGLGGVLAAHISGKTYEQLIDEYIFRPFKMGPKENLDPTNKSLGLYNLQKEAEYWNMNVLAPAGALQYSGSQMLTYLQKIATPISNASSIVINKILTPSINLNEVQSVGLGWQILNLKDLPSIYWHNGGTYGFSTFCAFTKDKSKAVIVVINQFSKNAIADGLGFKVLKKLIGEE